MNNIVELYMAVNQNVTLSMRCLKSYIYKLYYCPLPKIKVKIIKKKNLHAVNKFEN